VAPRIAVPNTPDALKLANAKLRFVERQDEIDARRSIYPLLYAYMVVLIGLTIFIIVAVALTASGVWSIPWPTLAGLGVGEGGLGSIAFFFKAPLNRLFAPTPQ